jgi:predicted ribonuclease YlaK
MTKEEIKKSMLEFLEKRMFEEYFIYLDELKNLTSNIRKSKIKRMFK